MKRVTLISLVLMSIVLVNCKSNRNADSADLNFVRELEYKHAHRYQQLDRRFNDMERQNFLLYIQSLRFRIEKEVGSEYANEFLTAFNDSAFNNTTGI